MCNNVYASFSGLPVNVNKHEGEPDYSPVVDIDKKILLNKNIVKCLTYLPMYMLNLYIV